MDFSTAPRKPRAESIVPMINVVFLLLIFFLMTAQIAPPDPFEVTPPTAVDGAEPQADDVFHVGAEGALQYLEHAGDAAFAALEARASDMPILQIRIDASLDGDRLAHVMKRLAAAGLERVEIVVVTQ